MQPTETRRLGGGFDYLPGSRPANRLRAGSSSPFRRGIQDYMRDIALTYLEPTVTGPVRTTLRRARFAIHLAEYRLAIKVKGFPIDDEPHFCDEGKAFFASAIEDVEAYLEYGSGGSTVTAQKFARILVSVDSDKDVLRAVRSKLLQRPALSAVKPRLTPADIGLTKEWGYPVFSRKTRERINKWKNYAQAPWVYLNSHLIQPNMIVVDGRFRVACTLESLLNLADDSKCKILVDDYFDRQHYRVIEKFADLVDMKGRMALFVKKSDMDLDECRYRADHYYADSR